MGIYQAKYINKSKSSKVSPVKTSTVTNVNIDMDYIVEDEILAIIKPEIINEVSHVLLDAGLINEFDSIELKLANVNSYQNNSNRNNLSLVQKRNIKYKTRCRTLSLLRAMNFIDDRTHKALFPQVAFPKDINLGIRPSLLTAEIQSIIAEKQSVFNKKTKIESIFSLAKNFLSLLNLT